MLRKPPQAAGRRSSGRSQGLLNAPWWRLLLWAAIVAAALLLAIQLRIVG
jgi:hypothetical protein